MTRISVSMCAILIVVLLGLFAIGNNLASAAVVSYTISGQFQINPSGDQFSGTYPGDVVPGLVNNPSLSGLLTYDTSATETSTGVFDPSSLGITLTLGGIGTFSRTAAGTLDALNLIDGTPGNNPDILRLEKMGLTNPPTAFDPDVLVTRVTIDVLDPSGGLAPGSLSAIDPTLPGYLVTLFLGLRGPSHFLANEGEIVDTEIITLLTLTAVPEPGSFALLAVGAVLLGNRRIRRCLRVHR